MDTRCSLKTSFRTGASFTRIVALRREMRKLCRRQPYVVVLDHHPTTAKDLEVIKATLSDRLIDLSTTNGTDCGMSLVKQFCDGFLEVNDDALHMFWKLDVFRHTLPPHLEQKYNAFKGYITQLGNGKCTLELADRFMQFPDVCLTEGDKLFEPTRQNTRLLAATATIEYSTDTLIVYMVDVDAALKAGIVSSDVIDPPIYQDEIDKLTRTNVAVAFVTAHRKINDVGTWNLGLRRAGTDISMDRVAVALKESSIGRCMGFCGGGGHAFAAGAQCSKDGLATKSIEDLIAAVVYACKEAVAHAQVTEDAKAFKKLKV